MLDEPSYDNTRWFVKGQSGKKYGPYTHQQIIDMYNSKQLSYSSYVACTGMKKWTLLSNSPLVSTIKENEENNSNNEYFT